MRHLVYLLLAVFLLPSMNLGAQGVPNATLPPEPSTVYSDPQFAPHIFASTDRAAFYAFGRTQMKDLPTSVAYNFALGAGKLSSIFGAGVPTTDGRFLHIKQDMQALQWRLRQRGILQASTLPADIRDMILAYTLGINDSRLTWLANVNSLVLNTEPYSFDLPTLIRLLSRPITFEDVMTYGVYFVAQEGIGSNDNLAYSDDPNATETHIKTASNSYAIGRASSSNERAMLLGDPHLPFQKLPVLRTYFCQIHGSSYQMCGLSLPALPCIGTGYNSDFGWAITSNNPDSFDVWCAQANSTGASFSIDGDPVPIIRQTKIIDVFDFISNSVVPKPVIISYAGNLNTPIVRETTLGLTPTIAAGRTIWYARIAIDSDKSAWEFLIRMGQARSVEEAKPVLDMNLGGGNYLMADSTGDLGYLYSGRVPIRKDPTPGTTWANVQDGNTGGNHWRGIHPVSDLPWEQLSESKKSTYVDEKWLQCNSAADLVRPNTTMNLDDYPDYMVHQETTPETWRQRRGRELLDAQDRVSSADLRGLSTDIQDIWYDALAPYIDAVVDEFVLERYPQVVQMMSTLHSWDRIARVTDTEPIYTHMLYTYFVGFQKKYKEKTIGGVYDDFGFPEQLPSLEEWWTSDWDVVRSNIAASVINAATTYNTLINTVLPLVTFPQSPWTPNPWAGYSTVIPEWGTAHYVTLTPYSAPDKVALYPVGGSISQFALGSELVPNIEDTIIENTGILGQFGTLISYPIDAGAHTLFQVTFGDPVEAYYLEALGPTEIANNPKRYVNAAKFAARIYTPFLCRLLDVISVSTETVNYSLDVNVLGP
ncbi:MAG: hypothetical protein ACI97A_001865 [Planctomycetota bacterium]|jgi:hypothetical protein